MTLYERVDAGCDRNLFLLFILCALFFVIFFNVLNNHDLRRNAPPGYAHLSAHVDGLGEEGR